MSNYAGVPDKIAEVIDAVFDSDGAGLRISGMINALVGTHAERPTAGPTNDKYLYYETDTSALFQSISSAWTQIAAPGTLKCVKVALGASDSGGGILSWQNPESGAIAVVRILVDVTTVASGACSASFGATVVSSSTSSANLIDTQDVHSAAILLDNLTTPGSNGKARQRLASGGWVTGSKASGAASGLVGSAYIEYLVL